HVTTMEAGWGGGVSPFGATWQKTMMWIFIVTDALLFSGLLCGYAFLRQAGAAPWPDRSHVFSIAFIALMTFILITSSMTMGTAVTAARLGDRKTAMANLAFTIVGGAAFLSCQAYEWTHLIREGARLTGALPGSETASAASPYRIYRITWAILLVITVAMLLAEKFHLPRVFLILFLLAFMMVKATMIGGNFMHLRFERRNLAWMVALGILVT